MPDPGNLDETISGVRDGDLTALLARAEAAEGPDRELDMLIWRHLLFDPHLDAGGSPLSMPGLAYSKPPYTASLDAALTLVERMAPDALWRVGSFDGRFSARIAHYGPSGRSTLLVNTYGKTPALALLAALLKALIAQAADTSARNVPARERASNASRAATGPLPRIAPEAEPSGSVKP